MKPITLTFSMLLVALLPSMALANAGTPLMWASMAHLVFGNALIGLLEGLLLGWMFKAPRWRSILLLVAANYASAWTGGFLISGALAPLPDMTIESLAYWFWGFVTIAFVVTLAIEWPFILYALRRQERPVQRALRATPIVHGISYSLIFVWYWLASGTSLLTQLHVVPPRDLAPAEKYAMYFIAQDGRHVIKTDLAGARREEVRSISSSHRNDRLFVRRNATHDYALFVHFHSDVRGGERDELILDHFSHHASVDRRIEKGHSEKPEGTWFNFGPASSLVADSGWKFYTGFWPVEGISGENAKEGTRFHYSIETPFAAWVVRNATQVAEDRVVFQLGDDQICILDPTTKRIALITRGKGPIVAQQKWSNHGLERTATAVAHP